MDNVFIATRILDLAKERNVKVAGLCREAGLNNTKYLFNLRAGRTSITEEQVETFAELLYTTPAYLLGKTDQKEKPADLSVNGLSAEQQRIIDLWSAASPEIRAAARAVLETGVPGALAPDAQEAQQ